MYDEVHNISNTPCVNVTILDDDIPENEKFIILRLSMASYDQNLAITSAGKNQTVIKILDNDHGMLLHVCYSIMNSIQLALCAENFKFVTGFKNSFHRPFYVANETLSISNK
jgi:hypothetical protein